MIVSEINNAVKSLRVVICDDNLKRASALQKLCFEHGVKNATILNKIVHSTENDVLFVGGSKASKDFVKPVKGKMPVIFVTQSDTSSVFNAYMNGATQVITDPIKTTDVIDCLWSAVRYRGQHAEIPEVICWKQSCQLKSKLA